MQSDRSRAERDIVNQWEVGHYRSRFPEEFAVCRAGYAVRLLEVRRQDWSAPLDLYVMWCAACEKYTVSHAHGYDGRVPCGSCRSVAYPRAMRLRRQSLVQAAWSFVGSLFRRFSRR